MQGNEHQGKARARTLEIKFKHAGEIIRKANTICSVSKCQHSTPIHCNKRVALLRQFDYESTRAIKVRLIVLHLIYPFLVSLSCVLPTLRPPVDMRWTAVCEACRSSLFPLPTIPLSSSQFLTSPYVSQSPYFHILQLTTNFR